MPVADFAQLLFGRILKESGLRRSVIQDELLPEIYRGVILLCSTAG